MMTDSCPYCSHILTKTSVVNEEHTDGETKTGRFVAVGVGTAHTLHCKCATCGAQMDLTLKIIALPTNKNYRANKPT
jgi:DNA-directed RNA polymerase subunit RPC12/RpoP